MSTALRQLPPRNTLARAPTSSVTRGDGHLTPAESQWHFWRQAECRTAGFPAADALPFGDPALSEAATNCLRATEASTQAWDSLRTTAKSRIRELLVTQRTCGDGTPEFMRIGREILQWRKAVKHIDRRRNDTELSACFPMDICTAAVAAELQRERASADFHQAWILAAEKAQRHAARLAADPLLREAVTWQNRPALHASLNLVAQSGGTRDDATGRRANLLLASYAQRYMMKNDTIGFFGPVGWSSFQEGISSLQFNAGETLLAKRSVYFEDWAMRALADRLSADVALRPWQVPRRVPHLRLEGSRLWVAGRPVEASAEECALLGLCDGRRTSRQIATLLLAHPLLNFEFEKEVLDLLERLSDRRRIDLRFEVRVGDRHPELHLRHQLERIDQRDLREAALSSLQVLEQARGEVARAAGDVQRLNAALAEFDAHFESVCFTSATRNAGVTYGARKPLYEDCVRNMQLAVGTQLRRSLQTPLSLVLQGARWFCHRLGRIVEARLGEVHDSLADANAKAVDLDVFWLHAQDVFFGSITPEIDSLVAEHGRHWATLLIANEPDARRIEWSSEVLRKRVASIFEAPDCGWASGCHQSPDVMVSARSPDDCDASFVLGEVHAGINTLLNHSAQAQHPNPDALMAALQADLQQGRFIPVLSREETRQPIRVQVVTQPGHDTELCFSSDARPLSADHAMVISDLVVERHEGRLVARHRRGGSHRLLVDVFGELLSGLAATRFSLLPNIAHSPRVTIDRLVVQREAWRFPLGDLPFLDARDDVNAYLDVHRWRQLHGLPRLIFVKLPWEAKPFYIDLDSPIYAMMLCRQLRNALRRDVPLSSEIAVTEMLPTPEFLWLTDEAGRRFTSELRIVAIHEADRRPHEDAVSPLHEAQSHSGLAPF